VRRQILLDVQKGELQISRRLKKIAQGIIHENDAAVVRVLQALFPDVCRDALSHFTSADHFIPGAEESRELFGNLLRAVEAVVLASLRLLGAVRVLLVRANASAHAGDGLKFGLDLGDFLLHGAHDILRYSGAIALSHVFFEMYINGYRNLLRGEHQGSPQENSVLR